MLLKNKKIAIIGGGPGGLTLAKLLQLKGVEVKVYERDQNKFARVQGSPLDLHEQSGLAALRKAGLLDEFRKHYMPGADKTTITDPTGKILFSDHEIKRKKNFGDAHFRPEIDRGVLRMILLNALEKETVVWDSHFINMENQDNGWLLHFRNRQSVYADLVIGADGANSRIRPYLTDIKPFYTGITMLEGNIHKPDSIDLNINAILKGGKVMAFGKNQNILMGQKANSEIGFYSSFKTEEGWVANSDVDFSKGAAALEWFKKAYTDWDPLWQELIEKASSPFVPRPIYCMPLDQQWTSLPNLTIIGDAAHLMPPFAGEGVNMAMLDALELSEALTNQTSQSMLERIGHFESNMLKRASMIAQESLDNGEKMHAEDALANMLDFFGGSAS
ncbi:NAD(P)/FAD-dependent oxidoreductase [Pedobacter aquatilis]|uniref:FAD-dependent oxidoreductase n=1 Tax=Pedobacter aquatilis TaxID=351343 RepID=UPI00293006AE|nr:NAD(P)/FAD-dependent oxidoreductase [Pedobacter aquatilis]